MHKEHKKIVAELKKLAPKAGAERQYFENDSYTGSTHEFYSVSVPLRRALLKEWLNEHKEATAGDVVELVDALIHGASHEEKTMGAMLLGYHKKARAIVTVQEIDEWLNELVGWAEVDALCQNIFTASELLENWNVWKKFLIQLSKSKNINKRRASLVFLTGTTSRSDDKRLHELAYENIGLLKGEKDILITKATSWLLRSMADTRKTDVAKYLQNEKDMLPKIAVRETLRKLQTGKKNK